MRRSSEEREHAEKETEICAGSHKRRRKEKSGRLGGEHWLLKEREGFLFNIAKLGDRFSQGIWGEELFIKGGEKGGKLCRLGKGKNAEKVNTMTGELRFLPNLRSSATEI